MDPNLNRWVTASVRSYFRNNYHNVNGYPFLFFEDEHKTGQTETLGTYYVLRVDGPHFDQITKNDLKVDLIINLLHVFRPIESDTYQRHQELGMLSAAFKSIQCFKYGDRPGDDDSYVGCLNLISSVDIHDFGFVGEETRLLQAIIEGNYQMRLKT